MSIDFFVHQVQFNQLFTFTLSIVIFFLYNPINLHTILDLNQNQLILSDQQVLVIEVIAHLNVLVRESEQQ